MHRGLRPPSSGHFLRWAVGPPARKAPAAIQIARADGEPDDARLRRQPGQQRQLDLDGVFALVSAGVHLQAGDRGAKLLRSMLYQLLPCETARFVNW